MVERNEQSGAVVNGVYTEERTPQKEMYFQEGTLTFSVANGYNEALDLPPKRTPTVHEL